MTNRLVSAILVLTLILGVFTVLPASANAKTRNPFEPFEALSYDDVVIKAGAIDTKNGGLGGICGGSYAVFKNLNFTQAPIQIRVESATKADYTGHYFELRLDSPEGKLLGRYVPPNTGGWNSYKETIVPITEEITGVHDLYFVFTGNAIVPVRNIVFVPTSDAMLRFPVAKTMDEYKDITNKDDYSIAETLVSLGLTSPSSDGNYGSSEEFTIGEALMAASVMLGLDFENQVKPLGMSDADFFRVFGYEMGYDFNRYAETDPISVQDLTGLMLGTLGWLDVIDYMDTDVMALGTKLKLFNGVTSKSKASVLNKCDASRIIYNALSAKVLQVESWSKDGHTYTEVNDIGVMAVFADVYKGEGVVSDNALTSLSTPLSSLRDDEVKIGGQTYKTGSSGVAYAIGSRVNYFYKYDSKTGKKTILYYEIDDSQSVTITSDNLSRITMGKIEYYDGDRKKYISYNVSSPIIYNSVLAEEYTSLANLIGNINDFKGSITVIDNGEGEIIKIYSYKSVLMQRFSEDTGMLIDEYGNNINFKRNAFTTGEKDFKYTSYNTEGGVIDLTNYPPFTVADVAVSHNSSGKNYVQIVVPDNVIYGKITQIESNSSVVIDGISYKIAPEYIKAVAAGEATVLDANCEGDFYLDSFGNICAYKSDSKDIVGIIMDFEHNADAFTDCLSVKLYTYEGEMIEADFTDSAIIDGVKVGASNSSFSNFGDVVNYLKQNLNALKGSVVSYRINNSGKVYYFDTMLELARNDNDLMKRIASVRTVSKFLGGVLSTTSGDVVWDGNVIFRAPVPGSVSSDIDEYYSLLTALPTGEDMFDCYSTSGDDSEVDVAVCVGEKNQWQYHKFLVERVSNVLLPDGTPTKAIDGWVYGYAFTPSKTKLTFDSVNAYNSLLSDLIGPGDILNIVYDINKNVINSNGTAGLPSGVATSSVMYDYSTATLGTVTNVKGEYGQHYLAEVVKMTDKYMFFETSAGATYAANIETTQVLCFDGSRRKARLANLADLHTRENNGTGTTVLIGSDNNKATTIIYYEN